MRAGGAQRAPHLARVEFCIQEMAIRLGFLRSLREGEVALREGGSTNPLATALFRWPASRRRRNLGKSEPFLHRAELRSGRFLLPKPAFNKPDACLPLDLGRARRRSRAANPISTCPDPIAALPRICFRENKFACGKL